MTNIKLYKKKRQVNKGKAKVKQREREKKSAIILFTNYTDHVKLNITKI